MRDIADETDLSKAAIHYHYDCKHDLLVSFLDHLYDRFEDRIRDPDGDTPVERLHTLVDTLLVERAETPAFRTALLEIKAQAPYDDAFRDRLRRFDDTFAATVRELVGEEQGKPFRPREILFVDEFPKTQSGKIIRRAVEATYTGEDLGDLSSIENPDALDNIENAR